ncbi:MAG: ATP-binding cassette domain-containing protein [Gammaproteobacteria bacterium]|nr:ATP-binding cassette domain-containing protein [Gammaproteobacteria bacterium]
MREDHAVPAADDAAVQALGLTRRFGRLTAVDRLDLTVSNRSIFGLLGPNGAGKSTTIKMLTTLLRPTAGTARVAGSDIISAPRAVRRRIGYVPQLLSADGALTGVENLMLSARLYGIGERESRTRIDESLRFMGLEEAAGKLVRTYSGGMIRRLEVAQAMLHRPRVLFLDEPTIGLDPVARATVWSRLEELQQTYGTTVFLTTHDMEEADELCDEIAIMHRGHIAVNGAPADLKESVGPDADLGDVFAHYSGGAIEEGGEYRNVRRMRVTAKRLG